MIAVCAAVAKALAIIVGVAGPIAIFGAWASGDRVRPSRAVLPRAALVKRRVRDAG
jgi:hypothetical protein